MEEAKPEMVQLDDLTEDQEQMPVQEHEIDVPEGGYGWFVVVAVFLFNFSTWGANASYAIYLAEYLNNDTFPGTSREEFGVIGGLAFGAGFIFAPALNYTVGFLGVRPVISIGALLQFASLMMTSWAVSYWQIALAQGLLFGFAMALICVPNLVLLPQWFRRKRSLAAGLAAAGSGLGGIIFCLAMAHVVEVKNYKWALRIEAIVCLAANVVGIALTRTRSKHIKTEFKFFDRKCFNFGFSMEILWVFCLILGFVVLLYELADFTVSLGYSTNQGSTVNTMLSVGGFCFRPLIGVIADRWGPITVSIYVHLMVAIFAWAMWIPARNLATAILFSLIEGGAAGSIWVVSPTITARIVGLRKVGVCMGTLWIFIGVAAVISPVVGLKLKRPSRSDTGEDPTQYIDAAIFVGCCYFVAAAALFFMRGWIITRDEISAGMKAGETTGEDSSEDLNITVPFGKGFRNCFRLKPFKKT